MKKMSIGDYEVANAEKVMLECQFCDFKMPISKAALLFIFERCGHLWYLDELYSCCQKLASHCLENHKRKRGAEPYVTQVLLDALMPMLVANTLGFVKRGLSK